MTAPDDEPFLKTTAAAAIVGVSPESLSRWARDGKLTHIATKGGHRRFRVSDIQRLMGEGFGTPPESPEDRAVRLYEEGLSVRRVAARMGWKQTTTLRLLQKRTTMRDQAPRAPLSGKLAAAAERLASTTQRVLDSDVEPEDVVSLASYLYALAEHGRTLAGSAIDQAAAAKVDADATQAPAWMDTELYLSHVAALCDALASFAGDACRRIEGLDSGHLAGSGAPANESPGTGVTPLPPAEMADTTPHE